MWNTTHNLGNTLIIYLTSILYVFRIKSIYLTRQMFPWTGQWQSACNREAQRKYNRHVNRMKFAIINPQLEEFLRIVNNRDVKMAMLLQHRFVLRAEHYCKPTKQDKDCLRIKHIKFLPTQYAPTHLQITIYHDKNHIFKQPMTRIVKCTCQTKWSCVVHNLKGYLYGFDLKKPTLNKIKQLEEPLIGSSNKPLTYDKMQKTLKKVVIEAGYDPDNYGTHSFRAGGATELHCEGRDLIYIKEFGHWKSMDSVYGYLRPRNADRHNYIIDWDKYCAYRRKETGLNAPHTLIFNRIIHRHYQNIRG